MPTNSATLSLVPKVEIARSLSHAGVASTNAPPTATTGFDAGSNSTDTREATPSVTAPESTPESAARAWGRRPCPGVGWSAAGGVGAGVCSPVNVMS